MKKVLSVFLALLICVSIIPLGTLRTEALSPSYSVSSYYASGSYYTALCNVSLTGNQRTDIANVAKSQVGYHEGNSNGDMNGKNTSGSNNYCEYNYWYYGGAHNGGADYAWCAVFISWCASQAQISTSIVKKNAWAGGSGATFGGTKQLFSSGYTPQAGDIVHINNDSDSDSDHVGLIYAVDSSYIYTVEGNASNKVVQYKYSRSNGKLNGTSSTSIIFYEVPSYTNSEPPTGAWIWKNKDLVKVGEEISFNYNATNATGFTLGIDKVGVGRVRKLLKWGQMTGIPPHLMRLVSTRFMRLAGTR